MTKSAAETQSAIIPFSFESQEVRTIQDEHGEPWFVAKDICDVLEHSDPHKAVASLDDDEKDRKKVPTLGGNQDLWVVSESGLYTLIIRSNKPEAKKFRKWVTSEVLPAIRKTGSYNLKKTCNVCNQTLPVEAFGKDAQRGDGLNYTCMACRRVRDRIYRQNKLEASGKKQKVSSSFDGISGGINDKDLAMKMFETLGSVLNVFLNRVADIKEQEVMANGAILSEMSDRIERMERRMSSF